MNFESYLVSKKIDPDDFLASEKSTWEAWRNEFEQMSPSSFTAQKLFLINPIRRKYPLKASREVITGQSSSQPASTIPPTVVSDPLKPDAKPAVARPVMKPKPKIT